VKEGGEGPIARANGEPEAAEAKPPTVPIHARSLSRGAGFCAVLVDGRVACGQGDVTIVPGVTNAVTVDASSSEACAVTAGGEVSCWAFPVGYIKRGPIGGVSRVALGESYSCALHFTGGISCWGSLNYGQSESGEDSYEDPGEHPRPKAIYGLPRMTDVVVGASVACGLGAGGEVYCWGNNTLGLLGNGTVARRTVPARARVGPSVAVAIRGEQFTSVCATIHDGSARCWGTLEYRTSATVGETPPISPSPTPPLDDVRDATFFSRHDSYLTRGGVARIGFFAIKNTVWMAPHGRWGLRGDGTVWNDPTESGFGGQGPIVPDHRDDNAGEVRLPRLVGLGASP